MNTQRRTACLGCTMFEEDDGRVIPAYVSGCPTHDPEGERHPSATVQSWYIDGVRSERTVAEEEAAYARWMARQMKGDPSR